MFNLRFLSLDNIFMNLDSDVISMIEIIFSKYRRIYGTYTMYRSDLARSKLFIAFSKQK